MAENIDYAAILADLEAKKAALEGAIAAVRSAIAMGAAGQSGDVSAAASSPSGGISSLHNGEVPAGAFLGKSIPEAAKLYLAIVKKKQTSKEIAEGLKRGGIESTAKNFFGIVHSILDRTRKSNGGVVKLDRSHWGLTDWYPRGVASSPAPSGKKTKGKKKAAKKAAPQKQEPEAENSVPVPAARTGKGLNGRMLAILREHPHQEFSAEYLSKKLGANARVISMQMSKLVKERQAEKVAGGYRAISNVRPMPSATAAVV
jgi:hypothetical protein